MHITVHTHPEAWSGHVEQSLRFVASYIGDSHLVNERLNEHFQGTTIIVWIGYDHCLWEETNTSPYFQKTYVVIPFDDPGKFDHREITQEEFDLLLATLDFPKLQGAPQ